MATKDVTDLMVCRACKQFHGTHGGPFVNEILQAQTGEPLKVCDRAMERSQERGLIDCGVSLRTAWVTAKGEELLKETA